MATQLNEKSTTKHDAFIEAQLARVENRIRLIDLTAAALGFVAGTLAFAVVMILLDQRFALSAGTRQWGLFVYLVAAAVYLAITVVRPLRWQVNPYYAARQLEQTVPGARNHVINWIDLHGEKVPAVLKGNLGQRAAKDLSKADVDSAISNRRVLAAGGAAALSVLVFVLLFLIFGPRPFASLLSRAFTPFGRGSEIASRTQVKIIRPGDTTVTIGNPITIVAQVGGRVPNARDEDAPCLLYRHQDGEPYRQRFLQPDDTNQEWFATIGPLDVGNGFTYKVRAGDAQTQEFRVDVRAAPLIADFLATYRYRPYVGKADRTRTSRKLEDLRGTEVILVAHTNRIIKEGRLEFEGDNGVGDLLRSQPVPNDPKVLQFTMVLDRAGKYRIRFTSTDNEVYSDSIAYEVQIIPDLPPQVRLTAPAKDVTLPANGHLELKGEASDDIGIARLTLRLQIVGGPELKSKPFMADKLNAPNYGTPRAIDYKDLLELGTLQTSDGKPAELKAGTEIEYWLEAEDACDYPRPNVTASKPRYKITISEASKEGKQQKEREAARNRQKENQKQQEDQLKKDKASRDAERKKEEKQEKEDEKNRKEEREKKAGASKEEKKDKGDPKESDKPGSSEKDKELSRKAEQLKEKLEKKQKEEAGKRGEGKGENKPGKGKEGEKKAGKEKDGKDKPGQGRGDGGQDRKNPAGEKKQEGGKPGDKGEGRGEGKSDAKDVKGEGKKGSDKAEPGKKPGQGKETPAPKPRPGQGKGAGKSEPGKGEPGKGAGERKPENPAKPDDLAKRGEARESKTPGKATDPKPGEGKPGASASKEKGKGKPDEKSGGSGSGNTTEKKQPKPEDAKPSDVKDLLRKLKELADRDAKAKAKSDLQDIKNKARDGQAREAAKQALEEAARGKPEGEDKVPGGKDSGKKDPGKKGNPAGDPTDPTRGKGKEPKGPGEGGGDPGKGKEPGERRGTNPGEGGTGDRRPDGGRGSGDRRFDPETPEKHRATMLQLEEFRRKVDKDILKDMKMSPDEYKKFLEDYADLAKRHAKADVEAPEAVAPPQHKSSLPSVVGRSRKPGAGKTDDVRSEGRPQPPPEYRDKVRDFNRLLLTPPK